MHYNVERIMYKHWLCTVVQYVLYIQKHMIRFNIHITATHIN
jgi:hypothetical protein